MVNMQSLCVYIGEVEEQNVLLNRHLPKVLYLPCYDFLYLDTPKIKTRLTLG